MANYIVIGRGYIGHFEQYDDALAVAEFVNGSVFSVWGLTR